jgi:hypothetical protein
MKHNYLKKGPVGTVAFGPFQRTAPGPPWVGRLLVVTLLGAAFGA